MSLEKTLINFNIFLFALGLSSCTAFLDVESAKNKKQSASEGALTLVMDTE